jgi:hypothetical protein
MAIEQTLASMAHRQLTQNMPSLASNLLGFELIANNDENTFALGVNVAIIGDTYVYIPTILKNGRIAPVDLMYVPELDQFLPCKDAWITYLQSKKTDLMAAVRQKKGGTKGQGARKTKNREEELERKIMKLEIENARLKKGYLVKGGRAQKEYVTTLDENMK